MRESTNRFLFILGCAVLAAAFAPFDPAVKPDWAAHLLQGSMGALLAAAAVLAEWRIRHVPMRVLAGALIGALTGGFSGFLLLKAVLPAAAESLGGLSFDVLRPLTVLALAYAGGAVGAAKAHNFRPGVFRALFTDTAREGRVLKILDTSVIIDGRIADVAETGFLEGTIVLPQFVLRELQYVADSSDPLKRNRGRKGLDILQRIKKNPNLDVSVTETDFPEVREVDQKLIELARTIGGKIVTNDFNLNKVAQLNGIEVLNINELANSLKPVVLPGETMKVYIVKEGKEPDQGVAYLDDGTMVVINSAAKQIGRTVEVTITSVVQTAAGKMFFARGLSDQEKNAGRRAQKERA
ncbi:MAG TPA: PIN domain-containing protein [Candidatus Saccharimonadales bacterium]|nr:PIN domain-containing protein [Candidatus Saccharimonadales bacterium]